MNDHLAIIANHVTPLINWVHYYVIVNDTIITIANITVAVIF